LALYMMWATSSILKEQPMIDLLVENSEADLDMLQNVKGLTRAI